jgi:OOP family OmpA-OmpF porin
MRTFAPLFCVVAMIGAGFAVTGCTASASIGTTPKEPRPAPQPRERPAPAAKPKPTYSVEKGQLKLPGPIVFESGKDIIKPESDEVLSVVKQYLDDKQEITKLRIEGHTDSDGDDKMNQSLSELRSLAVARWLVGKGVDCKRLVAVGFGETKPIADNNTADGKAQNRRTAFINAELKGKPIGGMPIDGGGKVGGDPCSLR